MKAVVYHGVGDVRFEDVPDPKIEQPTDAIVRIAANAVCGTDLHLVRGTVPGMRPGTVLGHEAVAVVQELGKGVRNLMEGDRVVVCSSIACGNCVYCRAGWYAQCDRANPNGPRAGTAFFGGPESSGAFDGLQAEKARIPFAGVGLVKLPVDVTDEQALLVSDVFPTGWFAAELAHIEPGRTVAVFGCGPVGQFAILSARLMGAGRIFAIDSIPSRLAIARQQSAETINFEEEDPVEAIRELTGGIGVDRAIDAVGVDASHAHRGPAAEKAKKRDEELRKEVKEVAPDARAGEHFAPGDAPSQALEWAVESLAKGGTLAIVGVYPETARRFPIGAAVNKNLSIKMGNCNHRKYVDKLLDVVRSGIVDPAALVTQIAPFSSALDAYDAFDRREADWVKVELLPTLQ